MLKQHALFLQCIAMVIAINVCAFIIHKGIWVVEWLMGRAVSECGPSLVVI